MLLFELGCVWRIWIPVAQVLAELGKSAHGHGRTGPGGAQAADVALMPSAAPREAQRAPLGQ